MKADWRGELQDEAAYLDGRMRVKLARNEFVGLSELSTISNGCTGCLPGKSDEAVIISVIIAMGL